MDKIYLNKPIVSVQWLHQNLEASNIIVLDATMNKVTDNNSEQSNIQIPNARYFDIKNIFSDTSNPFPNAVPSEDQFSKEAQKLGISNDSAIVVYDDKGIYSSARVWWLFKAFNHENIAVLDGGLPEWIYAGYMHEPKRIYDGKKGNFSAKYHPEMFKFFKDIQSSIKNNDKLILDARSSDRFYGRVEEPREGLRSGNIPSSRSLPYTELISGNKLKDKNELISIFNKFDTSKELIFSCGSGITACILALGAELAGHKEISVYDGSWTEYGSLTKNQVMDNKTHWTKPELVAYILLYASQSDFLESNKEKNIIISKVDMNTFQKIHNEFDKDNDYQSIQKIISGLKEHNYSKMDIDLLFADIKGLFFADGNFNVSERTMYKLLKKLLS